MPLEARAPGPAPLTFRRGAHEPYAIRWFGSTALVGHLRHLGAEALASTQKDTRDWMRPQPPEELLEEVARTLEAPGEGATLAERIGRDVWIDFVADTGDDSDVSAAVASMVFERYALADGSGRELPRGDLLVFGGDTAYPTSSSAEVARRLIHPWNTVIWRKGIPDRQRVILGIPGNHDWYDGLDGFARLFRRDPLQERADLLDGLSRPPKKDGAGPGAGPGTGAGQGAGSGPDRRRRRSAEQEAGRLYRQMHLDELLGSLGLAKDAIESAVAVLTGRSVKQLSRLSLLGYRAVQEASYWLLPLAPGLDLWGVDRQLRSLDFRQRLFFNARRAGGSSARQVVVSPDPAISMGDRNRPGAEILKACGLSLKTDQVLYLTGDSHHYERRAVGASMHVIAGGGGSFVHGTRVRPYPPGRAPACAFPDQQVSRRLAASVPLQLVLGTGGILPHVLCAALAALQLAAFGLGSWTGWGVTALVAILATFFMFQAVSKRRERIGASLLVAIAHGPALALAPIGVPAILDELMPALASGVLDVALMAFVGPFILGHFLLMLVLTGLEHHQAYAVLGHPGFKHFVRLCVHPDGRVEGWTIGKEDTLGDEPAALIDAFTW